jgi:hypothetical protein
MNGIMGKRRAGKVAKRATTGLHMRPLAISGRRSDLPCVWPVCQSASLPVWVGLVKLDEQNQQEQVVLRIAGIIPTFLVPGRAVILTKGPDEGKRRGYGTTRTHRPFLPPLTEPSLESLPVFRPGDTAYNKLEWNWVSDVEWINMPGASGLQAP